MAAKNEEYARSVPMLNKVFAWSSIALLLCTVWMVWHDYSRPWKSYQRQFRQLLAEKTESDLKEIRQGLDQEELQQVESELEAAEVQVTQQQAEHQAVLSEISEINVRVFNLDRAYKNNKSVLDAARFEYEELAHHHDSGAETALEELHRLDAEVASLKDEWDLALQEQDQLRAKENEIIGARAELENKRRELLTEVRLVEKNLANVRPESLLMKGFEVFRNAPLVDFMAPSLKIEQVVLNNQSKDINFLTIPRVDRCQTCHKGAALNGFEEAPQPFTTHPRQELFVSANSPHPIERTGCTVCHYGLDRATDFHEAAHWPNSPEQEAQWEETHHWHPKHHEEQPMLPSRFVESSCLSCHRDSIHIEGADQWNHGRDLIERYGCFGCHKIRGYEGLRKPGPLLTRISWKTTPEWTYRWIEEPTAFRPTTRMPSFFGQDNNSGPEDVARTKQEIRGIVAYLFDKAETGEFPPLSGHGDAQRGEELVTQVGCLGCHTISRLEEGEASWRRRFGPDLDGMGSKVRPEWVYAWVKDPQKYFPETRMPNMRLTDREALDVTAYLMSLKVEGWESVMDEQDAALLDRLIREQLKTRFTSGQIAEKLASMSEHEKEVFLGEGVIRHYGCFGCHLIDGFETTPPIGTELSEEGSKPVDRLDFGFVEIPSTRHDWITQKLENPRIFDEGKVKGPYEKLRMPQFNFTEEERMAVVTAVLSFTKEDPPLPSTRRLGPRDKVLDAGRRLVSDNNCQGCHRLEGEGQEITPALARAMVTREGLGQEEAEVRAAAFSPPLITGEGARVRSDWLFGFLKEPTPIRPWLQVRMPTFKFTDQEANTLLQYFSALSEAEFPFQEMPAHSLREAELTAARQLMSPDIFNCYTCHQQGDRKPEGDPEGWAPDFALARERLRPDWIVEWIKDPQKLYPGTKMPTYFDQDYFDSSGPDDIMDGDEDRQILAIRNYLLSLGARRTGS